MTDAQKSQRDRALRARDAMFGRLFQELAAALAQGGAPAAIRVCAERAPAIAETVAEEHDVRIGRTSWKLRNPNNLPPVWADLLVDARPTEPVFLTDRTGRLGSLTPIRIASACVQCHGPEEQLAPDVRTALDDLYPEDRATGFEEGDLRGWFWVETPAGMGE